MACEFVPPKPNEFTLALRGCPSGTSGHGSRRFGFWRLVQNGASLVLRVSRCKLGGIACRLMACTTLRIPANPAAPSVCFFSVLFVLLFFFLFWGVLFCFLFLF